MKLRLFVLLTALLAPTAAWSQAAVYMCVELTSGNDRCQHVSVANPLPMTGAFTAASGAFASGSIASGAFASGSVASGAVASGAIAAGAQVDLLTMRGTKAAGTAAANSLLEGVVYNATTPVLTDGQQVAAQSDTTGARRISTEGLKTTYSAADVTVPAAGATDIFTITGSASKTIRVTRIAIEGQSTAAAPAAISLIKRSTANSGGTSAAGTAVPHDSGNAAATATILKYTANPTVGTPIGDVRRQTIVLTTAAGAIPTVPFIWDFTTRNTQAVVLRGTSQVLAVNYNGQTNAGNALSVEIEWTEE